MLTVAGVNALAEGGIQSRHTKESVKNDRGMPVPVGAAALLTDVHVLVLVRIVRERM